MTACSRLKPQVLRQELMLRLHQVPHGEFREGAAGLFFAVGGGGRHAVAEGVHGNDKIAGRIGKLGRPDEPQVDEIFRCASKPRGEQDRIGSLPVQRAEGAIPQAALLDHLAALETKITQVRQAKLALRVQELRGCKKNKQHQEECNSG